MGKKKAQAPEGQPAEGQQQQPQGSTGRAPPAHECRIGRIRGVVWRNDGKEGVWFSVNVTRSYKDGNDQWKQATSFGRDDLLVVAEVVRLCWLWIAQQNGTNLGNGHTENGGGEEIPI